MSALFSIITVTYNASQWLERTIRSVLGQTSSDWEYIIIDGGSVDGTQEIIRSYEDRIAYWVSEPDKGLYDAMNKGLKAASGHYVCFLNAGDTFFSPDTLLNLSRIIQEKNFPDIIYGETEIMDEEGETVGMRRLRAPKSLSWKSFRMGMLVCHQSFVVKRDVAMDYDLQYRLVSDYDWTIRCMKKADTIINSHLILSRFLVAGMSSTNRKDSLKERFAVMTKYYGFMPTIARHLWFATRYYFAKCFKGRVE
ncbi:glycosyltransferase [Bacteroidales bacterium OttesenSCG-928-L03]|nr:glycosyltransferase [Bacteroidales bacterium OttesenSCG-928-L03]